MRETKTKLIGIDVSPEYFLSYEDALKVANSLKIYITRLIDSKNEKGNPYSSLVLIGVSENNSHLGQMALLKTKGRGRPKKVFISKRNIKDKTNAHLHILIYANPADTIANKITKYLQKKYKKHIGWKKYCDSYGRTAVEYIFKQSRAVRTVKRNRYDVLDSGYYQSLIDESNRLERIIFTKTEYEDLAETLDSTSDLTSFDDVEKVVYNKPITFSIQTTFRNVISIVNKTILNNLKFYKWNQAP